MKLEVGGLYSIENGDEGYRIAKLLAYGDGTYHVRVYAQKFPSRPSTVDPSTLSIERYDFPGGGGFGHLPLGESGFLYWKRVLIMKTTVKPDELVGYNMWKRGAAKRSDPADN
jgi:hypothetical protein